MQDRIHQPYRAAICPLLPRLFPLAGMNGILGVALSGAGPAVLLIVANEEGLEGAANAVRLALEGMAEPELLQSRFLPGGASESWEQMSA
jgi:homoserine kinase